MSIRIVSNRCWSILLLLAVAGLAGCDAPGASAREVSPFVSSAADIHGVVDGISVSDAVRVREDVSRNRIWVLTLSEVRIYNTAATGKRLIRNIPLPVWSVVGVRNICMPDLVLDRAGSAIVSSNAEARLLRIDGDRFNLEDYAISFQQRAGMDVGFGALAFAADGSLFARTTPYGVLWRINLSNASAAPPSGTMNLPSDQCVITTEVMARQLQNELHAVRANDAS